MADGVLQRLAALPPEAVARCWNCHALATDPRRAWFFFCDEPCKQAWEVQMAFGEEAREETRRESAIG